LDATLKSLIQVELAATRDKRRSISASDLATSGKLTSKIGPRSQHQDTKGTDLQVRCTPSFSSIAGRTTNNSEMKAM